MKSTSHELIRFLENNISTFLGSWRQKVVISNNDEHKEEVKKNGLKMYELVKKTLRNY